MWTRGFGSVRTKQSVFRGDDLHITHIFIIAVSPELAINSLPDVVARRMEISAAANEELGLTTVFLHERFADSDDIWKRGPDPDDPSAFLR